MLPFSGILFDWLQKWLNQNNKVKNVTACSGLRSGPRFAMTAILAETYKTKNIWRAATTARIACIYNFIFTFETNDSYYFIFICLCLCLCVCVCIFFSLFSLHVVYTRMLLLWSGPANMNHHVQVLVISLGRFWVVFDFFFATLFLLRRLYKCVWANISWCVCVEFCSKCCFVNGTVVQYNVSHCNMYVCVFLYN